jgi:hypothetical protein
LELILFRLQILIFLITAKILGKYVKLEFTVLKGEFKGRKIWTNLNLINQNPIAEEIAQKEFATICRAVGKAVVQDTQQLHGIPIEMKVKVTPAKKEYPAKNSPAGYASLAKMKAPQSGEDDHEDDAPPWEGDAIGNMVDDDIPY